MAIRMAAAADVPAMRAIYAPYIVKTAISFEFTPPTQEEFAARFARITAQFPWLVWEEDGEVLGYAYADAAFARRAYGFVADLSIYLREDARGRGIGAKLYGVLEELLRRQGYCRVYGLVTSENAGSRAFHAAMGYRLAAEFRDCGKKFGRWHSVAWYEKVLRTGEPPLHFPVSWREISLEGAGLEP